MDPLLFVVHPSTHWDFSQACDHSTYMLMKSHLHKNTFILVDPKDYCRQYAESRNKIRSNRGEINPKDRERVLARNPTSAVVAGGQFGACHRKAVIELSHIESITTIHLPLKAIYAVAQWDQPVHAGYSLDLQKIPDYQHRGPHGPPDRLMYTTTLYELCNALADPETKNPFLDMIAQGYQREIPYITTASTTIDEVTIQIARDQPQHL